MQPLAVPRIERAGPACAVRRTLHRRSTRAPSRVVPPRWSARCGRCTCRRCPTPRRGPTRSAAPDRPTGRRSATGPILQPSSLPTAEDLPVKRRTGFRPPPTAADAPPIEPLDRVLPHRSGVPARDDRDPPRRDDHRVRSPRSRRRPSAPPGMPPRSRPRRPTPNPRPHRRCRRPQRAPHRAGRRARTGSTRTGSSPSAPSAVRAPPGRSTTTSCRPAGTPTWRPSRSRRSAAARSPRPRRRGGSARAARRACADGPCRRSPHRVSVDRAAVGPPCPRTRSASPSCSGPSPSRSCSRPTCSPRRRRARSSTSSSVRPTDGPAARADDRLEVPPPAAEQPFDDDDEGIDEVAVDYHVVSAATTGAIDLPQVEARPRTPRPC